MKKITAIILLISLLIMVGILYIRKVTFIPFATNQSEITKYNDSKKVVTLPEHYLELKVFYPFITKIKSINELKNDEIIVLPWNHKTKTLKHLSKNGFYFYESSNGAFQIYSIRKHYDNYQDFLINKLEMTIAGTVVLARGVHKSIQRTNNILLPWEGTNHLFKPEGINVVNFKSPLITNFEYPKSSWVLIGKKEYAKGLKQSNIHLASIAGNHMGDAKLNGLIETIEILNKNNVVTVGAGKSFDEAYQCKTIIKNDTTYGFLGFNNVPGSVAKATTDKIGIAWLDNDAIKSIRSCKKNVNFLTILVNWGIEYTHLPRKYEQNYALKMSEAGADLIIGDQAHWVQTHENINGTHVSYGMGNYIFDQHWSEKTTEGIIQKFYIYKNEIYAIKTIPIKLYKNGHVKPLENINDRYKEIIKAYNMKIKDEKNN